MKDCSQIDVDKAHVYGIFFAHESEEVPRHDKGAFRFCRPAASREAPVFAAKATDSSGRHFSITHRVTTGNRSGRATGEGTESDRSTHRTQYVGGTRRAQGCRCGARIPQARQDDRWPRPTECEATPGSIATVCFQATPSLFTEGAIALSTTHHYYRAFGTRNSGIGTKREGRA